MAKQAGSSRTFLSHTLPIYLIERRQQLMTAAVSFVAHLMLALLLAAWALPPETSEEWFSILAKAPPVEEEILQEPEELIAIVQPDSLKDLNVDSNIQQLMAAIDQKELTDLVAAEPDRDFAMDLEPTDSDMERIFKKGEFGGRTGAGKNAAIKKYGGTADSERAVVSGLEWLKSIQQKDGSWSFDAVTEEAQPGNFGETDMGATSMALLCFLGAGHTHQSEGPYQDNVQRALRYMLDNANMDTNDADLRGRYQGNSGMYVQGIATICLCEAHALVPRDRELEKVAQGAVRFIERAQEPIGGGWRYEPEEAGDTSVVGWQVMALQSAKSGRLRVRGSTLQNARTFLNSVDADDGARYGYRSPATNRDSMTAVGLLCRMYMGWGKDREALVRGVHHLSTIGPDKNNIYFNYYATQVLHHYGEDLWKKWNNRMRQQLVSTQIKEGPSAGSWPVTDPHGNRGGQIYQTTLSILTLEVYYRHLPIYQRLETGQVDPSAQ